MMPIWIIWEIMLDCAKKKSALIFKIVESLLKLFCTKFSAACVKKRKYLIYFGISLLVDPVDLSVSIVSDQEVVNSLASKIGKIYAQVKKNEESPDTDYLFNGLERSNLEKSIEKIETMNKMMMAMSIGKDEPTIQMEWAKGLATYRLKRNSPPF